MESNSNVDVDDIAENLSETIMQNNEFSLFSSPLVVKPMDAIASWGHSRTRNGRLGVFVVVSIRSIDQYDGIKAELLTAEQLQFSTS